MIRNYGVHYIDQFLSVFGPGPLEIKGCTLQRTVGLGDADDVVQLLLRTPEGIVGYIDINLANAFTENSWTAYGEYGSAKYIAGEGIVKLRYLAEGCRQTSLTLEDSYAAADRKYGRETDLNWIEDEIKLPAFEAATFYTSVWDYFAQGGTPVVPLAESLEVMRVIELCRQFPIENLDARAK